MEIELSEKKDKQNKGLNLSRRRFLAAGSLGLAGFWMTCSETMGARAIRELVSDVRRSVPIPGSKPLPGEWSDNAISAAWIGHATVLLNFHGIVVLTDPVLFSRVGVSTPFGIIGAKRLVAPALLPAELPKIDLVLLSHAHMDHLDYPSLRALKGQPQVVTAHATSDLLQRVPLQTPRSLRWGESTRIETCKGEVLVRAFEVRHWGARVRYDRFRGYNGYQLERNGRRIIFGGDTALTNTFKDIRQHGDSDLAIMPIGAYNPWVAAHCNPEEAVQMANDANAHYFLPVHFKTFPFGREGSYEPLERLERTLPEERLALRDIGETFVLDSAPHRTVS